MSNLIVITDLREGDQGIIHSIEGGEALTSRLAGMRIVSDSASHRSATKIGYTYIIFIIICMIGLGIRIGIMHLLIRYAGMSESP